MYKQKLDSMEGELRMGPTWGNIICLVSRHWTAPASIALVSPRGILYPRLAHLLPLPSSYQEYKENLVFNPHTTEGRTSICTITTISSTKTILNAAHAQVCPCSFCCLDDDMMCAYFTMLQLTPDTSVWCMLATVRGYCCHSEVMCMFGHVSKLLTIGLWTQTCT